MKAVHKAFNQYCVQLDSGNMVEVIDDCSVEFAMPCISCFDDDKLCLQPMLSTTLVVTPVLASACLPGAACWCSSSGAMAVQGSASKRAQSKIPRGDAKAKAEAEAKAKAKAPPPPLPGAKGGAASGSGAAGMQAPPFWGGAASSSGAAGMQLPPPRGSVASSSRAAGSQQPSPPPPGASDVGDARANDSGRDDNDPTGAGSAGGVDGC